MAHNSTEDTKKHIKKVKEYAVDFTFAFVAQVAVHDESKLHSPEKEAFDRMKALSDVEYASEEYKRIVEKNRPAIHHHYKHNKHHPEHFEAGTWDMSLINILEMLCDWKASTHRSKNGDIRKSIEYNAEKFGMSKELKHVLLNTVDEMGW